MTLEGHLHDLPLVDLLAIFQTTAKTGKLHFSQSPLQAFIWFNQGRLMRAVVLNATTCEILAQDDRAVIELLGWSDALFRFVAPSPSDPAQATIKQPLELLMWHASQERQQSPAQSNLTPQSQIAIVPRLDDTESCVSLTLEQWRVISHLVSEARVCDLASAMGIDYNELLPTLEKMLMQRLIAVRRPVKVAQRQFMGAAAPPPQPQRIRSFLDAMKARLRTAIHQTPSNSRMAQA